MSLETQLWSVLESNRFVVAKEIQQQENGRGDEDMKKKNELARGKRGYAMIDENALITS